MSLQTNECCAQLLARANKLTDEINGENGTIVSGMATSATNLAVIKS